MLLHTGFPDEGMLANEETPATGPSRSSQSALSKTVLTYANIGLEERENLALGLINNIKRRINSILISLLVKFGRGPLGRSIRSTTQAESCGVLWPSIYLLLNTIYIHSLT